jgi:hypothetical protein
MHAGCQLSPSFSVDLTSQKTLQIGNLTPALIMTVARRTLDITTAFTPQHYLAVQFHCSSCLCCCRKLDVRMRLVLLRTRDGDAADSPAAAKQLSQLVPACVAGKVGHIAAKSENEARSSKSIKCQMLTQPVM